jgi:hypothetical protein
LLDQCDPYSFALAVLAGVGQRLLHDAIDGVFLKCDEAAEFDGGLKLDLRPERLPVLVVARTNRLVSMSVIRRPSITPS